MFTNWNKEEKRRAFNKIRIVIDTIFGIVFTQLFLIANNPSFNQGMRLLVFAYSYERKQAICAAKAIIWQSHFFS